MVQKVLKVFKDHKEPKELQVTHHKGQEAQREHHQQDQEVQREHHHKDRKVTKDLKVTKVESEIPIKGLKDLSEHQHKVVVVQQAIQIKGHKDLQVLKVIKVSKDTLHPMDRKGLEVQQVLMVHKGPEEQQVPMDLKVS
jgi:hypothetical protein